MRGAPHKSCRTARLWRSNIQSMIQHVIYLLWFGCLLAEKVLIATL